LVQSGTFSAHFYDDCKHENYEKVFFLVCDSVGPLSSCLSRCSVVVGVLDELLALPSD